MHGSGVLILKSNDIIKASFDQGIINGIAEINLNNTDKYLLLIISIYFIIKIIILRIFANIYDGLQHGYTLHINEKLNIIKESVYFKGSLINS